MRTDIGEYIVGAYLKLEMECDVVDYNVRIPGGKLEGLGELDVVGYNFKNGNAYICEVTTHIRGLMYGSYEETIKRIRDKHHRQISYAQRFLKDRFENIHCMFWSPCVPKGKLTAALSEIQGLELVINGTYKEAINKLRVRAKDETHDAVNPFFRMLQILEHLRD